MKWSIQNEEIFTTVYEVDAASREEALNLFDLGDAILVDSYNDVFIDVSLADDE